MPIAALALAMATIGCEDFDAPKETPTDGGLITSSTAGFDGGGGGTGGSTGTSVKKKQVDASADASRDASEEVKLKTDFVVAQASKDFIFVPNPQKRAVTVIDPQSLSLADTRNLSCCGLRPTYLAVDARSNTAIVIDSETDQATILRVSAAAQKSKSIDNDTCIPEKKLGMCVLRGANAVAFSPNKGYALIYYSPDHMNNGEPAGGYQEVVVVGLETGKEWARRISVGLRPRQVFFAANNTMLYLVTDNGISVINLEKVSDPDKNITTADTYDFGASVDMSTLQIRLSAYGRYAVGFKPNDSKCYLLDTVVQKVMSLDLAAALNYRPDTGVPEDEDAGNLDADASAADGGAVKDAGPRLPVLVPGEVPAIGDVVLGSSPGGSSFALIALPRQYAVLRVPITDGFESDDFSPITTAYKNERDDRLEINKPPDKTPPTALLLDRGGLAPRVTLIKVQDKSTDLVRSIRLAGSVDTVEFSEDLANLAFLTHNLKSSRPGAQVVGYSVLSVNPPFAKFQATSASPGPSVFSADANALFVLVRDDANSVHQLHRISVDGLFVDVVELDGKPRTLGAIPGVKQLFVEQEHSGGQITLFDWNGKLVGSLTGFLSSDRVKE